MIIVDPVDPEIASVGAAGASGFVCKSAPPVLSAEKFRAFPSPLVAET
jgi:hypothetical protein